jgi:RNA polymerase sigma-70 factor (ECF subfamily)
MAEDQTPKRLDWIRCLLSAHEGSLLRYAARILGGDVERACDVVQDTFMKLCQKDPEELRGHEAEWLFTVCRNRALDVRRKEIRMRTMGDETIDAASRDPAPGEALEREESARQVLQAFAGLPDNQQEVLRLKFQGGLSYREISRVTSLSVTNVGFLIHTGLKSIRTRLRADTSLPAGS